MKKLPVEKQVQKIVKIITGGKYDIEVFAQLYVMEEQIRRGVYTYEELRKTAPLFCEYNLGEQRKIILQITQILLEEIKKEENSYLKTLRILEGLNATNSAQKVKKTSNKIKFCLEFYSLAMEVYTKNDQLKFKTIALLDRA